MLKWCFQCQQFMGEIPPYDDFSVTHGLCAKCEALPGDLFSGGAISHAQYLHTIFLTLFDAGRRNDFESASHIIGGAIDANCRPVDILVGMVAPMLYEIGEEWKRGALSVAAEHRFTAFCEGVVHAIEARLEAGSAAPSHARAPPLFLMNAPGNRHHLAVRVLALWLTSRGASVQVVDDYVSFGDLLQNIATKRPGHLLLSMAVTEQCDRVAEIAEAVQTLPPSLRPRIVVGGYPVKAGLIDAIPGAELTSDIARLQTLIGLPAVA
jgi:hypothetical protein